MKRNQWNQVYEPVPQALDQRLANTFSQLREHEPEARVARRLPLRTAAIVMALVVAVCGVGYALFSSQLADVFGWFYGQEKQEELLSGDIAITEQSYTLGDVTYTLNEVVYKDGMLYGLMTMRPRDGANVVLMASDHYVWETSGYNLHLGDKEEIPGDTPTYLELAEAQDAKIIMPICNMLGYVDENGELTVSDVGIVTLPNPDGSVRITFEFAGYDSEVNRADAYTLRLKPANWEVGRDGNHLREEGQSTYIGEEWEVTVTPEMKGDL